MGDVDIEKVLVSNQIPLVKKNCKYFIGYLHNGNKVKPLNIMLPKTSVYVNVMIDKLNECIYLIEDGNLSKKSVCPQKWTLIILVYQ